MKVSDIGEFGLIDLLDNMTGVTRRQDTDAGQNLILGIGDDTAA